MESPPIPIEMLQIGEFYDVQITDEPQSVCGALLLKKRSPEQATLLFLHSSKSNHRFTVQSVNFVLRKRSLQIETIQLETVYPYQAFSRPPDMVLGWPENYEDEAIMRQISEELSRVVSEGRLVFNLPHFWEGYLHIYFSYLWYTADCPKRSERHDLLLEFGICFFSALRDHILHSHPLSEESLITFANSLKTMKRFSKWSSHIRGKTALPLSLEKELRLAVLEMNLIEACRPAELSSKQFDNLWHFLIQRNPMKLVVWQLQKSLTLSKLLLGSRKAIEILSSRADCFTKLSEANFPGLRPEEILRVRIRVVSLDIKRVGKDSQQKWTEPNNKVVKQLLEDYEQYQVSLEELNRIILEEKLIDTIIESGNERLVEYVLSRSEVFPSVFASLKSNPEHKLKLNSWLTCVSVRTVLEDWSFLTWVSTNNILRPSSLPTYIQSMEAYQKIKVIVSVALEGKMRPDLLRNLLPNEIFGLMVFQVFRVGFTLSRSRQVMLFYFGSEEQCFDIARDIANPHIVGGHNAGKKVCFYLKHQKFDLWYMLGGSVYIQFLWVRQFISVKRLSTSLTRDISSYLA